MRTHPVPHHDPDEIPHDVIGLLALSIVLMMLLAFAAYILFGRAAGVLVSMMLGIIGIARLSRRASRERRDEKINPPATPPVDPHDRQIS